MIQKSDIWFQTDGGYTPLSKCVLTPLEKEPSAASSVLLWLMQKTVLPCLSQKSFPQSGFIRSEITSNCSAVRQINSPPANTFNSQGMFLFQHPLQHVHSSRWEQLDWPRPGRDLAFSEWPSAALLPLQLLELVDNVPHCSDCWYPVSACLMLLICTTACEHKHHSLIDICVVLKAQLAESQT